MSADIHYAEHVNEENAVLTIEEVPAPLWRRMLKTIFFGIFFLGLLTLFTLLKLPEEKIREIALGAINGQLSSSGMVVSAERGNLSLGWGFSYTLEKVSITAPGPGPAVKLDRVRVSPSLLPLVLKRYGGSFLVTQGSSELSGSGTISPGATSTPFSIDFDAKKADLGKLGLLPLAAGIQGSLPVTGSGNFSGDLSALSGLTGSATLELNNLVIEAQSIQGFALPRLLISSGTIDLRAERGKLSFKTFRLGRAGNPADDLTGSLSGDVALGKTAGLSTLDLKATFGLSDNVRKIPGMSLIEGFLTPFRQGDGSFVYPLTGRLDSLMPM